MLVGCTLGAGCEYISGVSGYRAGEEGACTAAEDCPATNTTCRERICDRGVCGFDNVPDGTPCNDSDGSVCFDGFCGDCIDNSQCTSGLDCIGGLCTTGQRGEPCQRAANCLAGPCVDEVCCDSLCDAPCYACSRAKTCGSSCSDAAECPHPEGVCAPVRAGTDPDAECALEGEACFDGGCAAGKIVFVTSQKFNADLGGLEGGDAKCQAAAEAACLPGEYKAWLSDETAEPDTRFVQASVPYLRVDGTMVALNYADLTDGRLEAPIARDEYGQPGPETVPLGTCGQGLVWTGTDPDGTLCRHSGFEHPIDDDETGNPRTCIDWTWGVPGHPTDVTKAGVAFGSSASNEVHWTVTCLADDICNSNLSLYCFEQ